RRTPHGSAHGPRGARCAGSLDMNRCAWLIHVFDSRRPGRKWWVMFDVEHGLLIKGKVGESRDKLIKAWPYALDKVFRFRGVHRESEAAMTIAGIRKAHSK